MASEETGIQLTKLLQAWSDGDQTALDQLAPLIYGELRKLARFHMSREAAGHTLQPTALINEAFLRMCEMKQADWKGRKQFYAAASLIMRRVLVDYARRKRSIKRGRGIKRVPFEEAIAQSANMTGITDILALDQALTRLAAVDSKKAQVFQFWFFAGMTVEEIAKTMEVGTLKVSRDLEFARAWLARELENVKEHE